MSRTPVAVRSSSSRSAAAATDCGLLAGAWSIDASRSTLRVSVKVGLFTVHGHFTDVQGTVDMGDDPAAITVSVTVLTESLTSGSRTMDSMLQGAGVIDTVKNPVIAFASRAIRPGRQPGSWEIDGLLATDGSVLDVTLETGEPIIDADGSLVLRARGSLTSRDAVRLLSRAGVEKLLGRTMELDLTVVAI